MGVRIKNINVYGECTKNIALYREFADQNLRKKNEKTEKTYHATAPLKGGL